MITVELVKKLIIDQFHEYDNLNIKKIAMQGHYNTVFQLGNHNLIVQIPWSIIIRKVYYEFEFI